MDGAYTDPAVRQAISESISQAEADRMRGDKIREELYGVKYATPTPSITVGTQVRLTGVVIQPEVIDGAVWVAVKGGFSTDAEVLIHPEHLEVIRQPFKRGEVVYLSGWPTIETCPCRVLEDEHEGKVLLVGEVEGSSASYVEAGAYERRND